MKAGWDLANIGDVCDVVNGGTPKTGVSAYWGGQHQWITPAEMGKRSTPYVSQTDRTITDQGLQNSSARPLPPQSVILSSRAPIGHLVINMTPMATNQGCKGLVPRGRVDHKFLYYYLGSIVDLLNDLGTGATFKELSGGKLKEVPIPLPPLPEQQRIVTLLDEAFDGIATARANAENNIQHTRGLFQSSLTSAVVGGLTRKWREEQDAKNQDADADFNEIFEKIEASKRKTSRSEVTAGHQIVTDAIPRKWMRTSIESLFNLIDYRGKNPPRSKSGRRLITAKNIKMGYLSDEPITFISEDVYKSWMVRGYPRSGDIFFVTEGHTMGFVALNTRDDNFALAQRTITLQPVVPFDTRFFFYFMMSFFFQELVKLNATGAAAVGMKASKFRSLPLPFPSIAEQQLIVSKLDALRTESARLESIYQQKLTALDALKKSLLHRAFNGDL